MEIIIRVCPGMFYNVDTQILPVINHSFISSKHFIVNFLKMPFDFPWRTCFYAIEDLAP